MTRRERRRMRGWLLDAVGITAALLFMALLTVVSSLTLGDRVGTAPASELDVQVIEPMEDWAMPTHDGYRPPITVYVATPEYIYSAGLAVGWEGTLGYSVWGDSFCWVVVPPLTEDTMWIWRHEFRHCAEGGWHPEPEAE